MSRIEIWLQEFAYSDLGAIKKLDEKKLTRMRF